MMQATEIPVMCADQNAVNGYWAAPREEPPARGLGTSAPPAGKKHRIPPGSEKMVAAMSVTIVILLIASAILANAVFGTRMVSALLTVGTGDVFIRDARPSGDNLTAFVPAEIEMSNDGTGSSGEINLWCAAFDRGQTNLLKSDFNVTQFYKMGDARPVTKLAEKDRPGSIVRAYGELRLPPGEYDVRLRIYEDAGKRTLVSGSVDVVVNRTQVTIQSPYKPEGRSPGRSYEAKASKGAMPGFDGPLALAAGTLALVAAVRRKTGLRNVNMDLRRF